MTNIFALHHAPEDQVGAIKEDLLQLELMNNGVKEAYEASDALRKNIRTVCELGSHYSAMEKKVQDLCFSLEAKNDKSMFLEQEKRSLGDTMKASHETKDTEMASAWKEASQKTKKAEDKLKSVKKLEEEKKTVEVAAKKSMEELAELKKHYAEWEGKLKHVSSKKLELEKLIKELDN